MRNDDWLNNNLYYWDRIAYQYNTFYTDRWSSLENDFILEKLEFLKEYEFANILDLGCGTGLGYNLCNTVNPDIQYTGVDISIEMLNVVKNDHPHTCVCNTSMSNLTCFNSNSFDVIISIFTAFSYTDNIENTINEISRVLKPNGKILISVIGKYSLRRLVKFEFGNSEKYITRGNPSERFSYAWAFSKNEISQKFKEKFTNIEINGYNALAGLGYLDKYPHLWKLNCFISKLLPDLSHELIIVANKKDNINA
jgi:ubiquinone/menaquinone biosynthesis C-methylase UbiE